MPKHFDLDVNQMFLVILCMADTMRVVANMMHGGANTMSWWGRRMWGVVGRSESVTDPPHMAKNKFLLNEY